MSKDNLDRIKLIHSRETPPIKSNFYFMKNLSTVYVFLFPKVSVSRPRSARRFLTFISSIRSDMLAHIHIRDQLTFLFSLFKFVSFDRRLLLEAEKKNNNKNLLMTTVTGPSTSSKAKIVIPSTTDTKSTNASGKKDPSTKTKPEFIVRTNYPDSNAPLGVSVSKFNKNHRVVSNETKYIEIIPFVLVCTSTFTDQRWSSSKRRWNNTR